MPSSEQQDASESARRFEDRVRSPDDVRRLSEFERRMYLPLMLGALLPIVTAASRSAEDSWVSITVNVLAWLVFVLDLGVHMRYVRRYVSTRVGMFDLAVVVVTAPWFLIPGFSGTQIVMLARLARVVRLLFVSKSARRAVGRLGKVGLFAVGMLLFASWMAYVAEHPTNSEFATYGDGLWWGIVTLTTVGYGDIVPATQKGRIAGTFLMITGLATLGLIAGTLASAFGLSPAATSGSDVREPDAGDVPEGDDVRDGDVRDGDVREGDRASVSAIVAELSAMRGQLATLEQRLASAGGPPDGE